MNRTVLIVDDSATTRGLIRRILTLSEVELDAVVEAADGQEALEIARGQPVSLILTDLHMPRMGGAELTRRLKGDPATRDIPVIVATSEPNQEVLNELWRAGINGYIPKPFTPEALRQVVLGVLGFGEPPATLAGAAGGGEKGADQTICGGACQGQAPRPFAADLTSLLRESLTTALETSAYVSPVPLSEAEEAEVPPRPLVASIAFRGPANGTLEIVAGNRFGSMIAANILGCDPSDTDTREHAEDALRELANVTCGVMLRVFRDGPCAVPSMDVPKVGEAGGDAWERLLRDAHATVLAADGHAVAVRYREAA